MSVCGSHHSGVFGAGALIAIVLALALPAQTRAACGGVHEIHATHHPPGQRPPLTIGDSTLLLAAYPLAHKGFEVNARGCRQMPEALALIRQRRAAGTLPHMVVIAVGSNGSVTPDEIGVALGLLCCKSWLVLVTPRELAGGSGADAQTERTEAHEHRNRTILLDWVKYSAGHGNWFQPDGLHLTSAGATAFTGLLSRALPYAYPKKPKRKKKRRRRAAAAADVTLRLRATLRQVGYVGVVVSGPPGVSVQLSSQAVRLGTTRTLDVVRLSGGTAEIPHLLAWGCGARELRLIASTVPPAPAAQASTVVTTPACSRRLVARIARRVRVGGRLGIVVRDRWRIGSLPLSACVTPPGARRSCRSLALAPGQRLLTLSVPIPRPGGWLVSVGTRYGDHHRALVWAAHRSGRILLLAAGDSEMQILDGFLGQDLAGHGVDVVDDARISTGLTKPATFDWEAHARRQAAALRPDVAVMFIGANDGFDVAGPHGAVGCCGPSWSAGYATLVARMMRTYLRGGAGRVYWFVLPTPRPGNFQSLFEGVNAGIRAAASRFTGRVALIDAASFFTPGGRYRDFMTYHGHGFVIHEPDGIHLSTAADQVAAGLVAGRLLQDRVIR